jgi:protein gp37
MGEVTGIAWTDHTLNAWIGCAKVSAGCKNCYAEQSPPTRKERHRGLELWGADAARKETKDWLKNVRKWYRAAVKAGQVRRVFAQSLADTFEDRPDLVDVRARLFAAMMECEPLIGAPPLHFQVLTKRPENIARMVPPSWLKSWPAHVWIGCTVEDQENADRRIPHLLRVPAAVRFLSVEPQIGPVDLRVALHQGEPRISWVIQGGESGPKARPFDLAWARSLRDQCRAAGVAYFLKQLGAHPAIGIGERGKYTTDPSGLTLQGGDATHACVVGLRDSHGGDENEWPADLRGCRAFPEVRP